MSKGRVLAGMAGALVCAVLAAVACAGVAAYRRDADRLAPVARAAGIDAGACRPEPLSGPGGEFVQVMALDPAGRTVVGRYRIRSTNWVARWVDGRAETLAFDFPIVTPAAVNADGVIVGSGSTGDAVDFPWMYRGGRVTRLPLPRGARTGAASGINARGDIVGAASWREQRGGPSTSRAVRWPAGRPGDVEVLADPVAWPTGTGTEEPINPAISWVVAVGVTDDGTVIGTVRREPAPGEEERGRGKRDDGERAYVWRLDGTGDYPHPPGLPRVTAITMLSGDWAIGRYDPAGNGGSVDFRWNRASAEVTDLGSFHPRTVDATGRMLGASGGRPVLWQRGTEQQLPTLPPADTGWALYASADSRTATGELRPTTYSTPLTVIWRC